MYSSEQRRWDYTACACDRRRRPLHQGHSGERRAQEVEGALSLEHVLHHVGGDALGPVLLLEARPPLILTPSSRLDVFPDGHEPGDTAEAPHRSTPA